MNIQPNIYKSRQDKTRQDKIHYPCSHSSIRSFFLPIQFNTLHFNSLLRDIDVSSPHSSGDCLSGSFPGSLDLLADFGGAVPVSTKRRLAKIR